MLGYSYVRPNAAEGKKLDKVHNTRNMGTMPLNKREKSILLTEMIESLFVIRTWEFRC